MEFHWEETAEGWLLNPSDPTVIHPVVIQEGHHWNVYADKRRLMPGNFNSEHWAKECAWSFVKQTRKSAFGAYNVRLIEAPIK
ncbi:hypothetical protein AAFG13_12475 [Bradyrhizobium sp. B124]|uniref:hypothetical protein n=1 Tax=Bradyrhizobium sp. B124 TaxID=3140245 RepID=UPI0031843465